MVNRKLHDVRMLLHVFAPQSDLSTGRTFGENCPNVFLKGNVLKLCFESLSHEIGSYKALALK